MGVIVLDYVETVVDGTFCSKVLSCPLGNNFINIAAILQLQLIAAEVDILFLGIYLAPIGITPAANGNFLRLNIKV